MSQQLSWTYSVAAVGGPTVAGDAKLEVDAYDCLHVSIPAGGNAAVDILPGPSPDVQLLVINPSKPSAQLTYEVDGDDVPLDGPHVLIGAGAVGLLAAEIGALTFTNAGAEAADIDILVGRKAI